MKRVPVLLLADRKTAAGEIVSQNGHARLQAAAESICDLLGREGFRPVPVVIACDAKMAEVYGIQLAVYCHRAARRHQQDPSLAEGLRPIVFSAGRHTVQALDLFIATGLLDAAADIGDPGARVDCSVSVAVHRQVYRRYAQVLSHYGYGNPYHLAVSEGGVSHKDRWLSFLVCCFLACRRAVCRPLGQPG